MMNYNPEQQCNGNCTCRGPQPACPPGPCPPCPPPPRPCSPVHPYWECIPGQPYRPPMNHQKHVDYYFYTVLFLDRYFDVPLPKPIKPAVALYENIVETFPAESPIYWKKDNTNILVINHKLHLPVTLEIWDKDNKPLIYASILKTTIDPITVGKAVVVSDTCIEVDFTGLTKPTLNEIYTLGMKEIPDMRLDCIQPDSAIKTLEEFMAVPRYCPQGLALVFRRNSLESLFDLIADFDQTYFYSLEEDTEVKYLAKKSCYKDVHFTTKYTNNLQDVIDLIDIHYYKVEYSWEDHKKYKDQYYGYPDKYGYI